MNAPRGTPSRRHAGGHADDVTALRKELRRAFVNGDIPAVKNLTKKAVEIISAEVSS